MLEPLKSFFASLYTHFFVRDRTTRAEEDKRPSENLHYARRVRDVLRKREQAWGELTTFLQNSYGWQAGSNDPYEFVSHVCEGLAARMRMFICNASSLSNTEQKPLTVRRCDTDEPLLSIGVDENSDLMASLGENKMTIGVTTLSPMVDIHLLTSRHSFQYTYDELEETIAAILKVAPDFPWCLPGLVTKGEGDQYQVMNIDYKGNDDIRKQADST